MPKIKANMSQPTCSAPRTRTCSARSSSPTSTTSDVSIADSPIPQRTGWWCGGTLRPVTSRPSGSETAAVAAAMNVNQWDDGEALQELVDTGRPVSDKELVAS